MAKFTGADPATLADELQWAISMCREGITSAETLADDFSRVEEQLQEIAAAMIE